MSARFELDAPARVLVVDDTELNRELLRGVLEAKGHTVELAERGDEALLVAIAERPPDAVLLDVMMPGMDGLTMCERLKKDDRTAHVPVLLITSLSDRAVRLRGVAAGANDFLVKPVDTQDVVLRVRNAVRFKRAYDAQRAANAQLRESEARRDALVHMLVHDLRSPLFTVRLYLEAMLAEERVARDEELRSDVERSHAVTSGMMEMIGSILDMSRLEAGEMPLARERCAVRALFDEALESAKGLAHGRRFALDATGLEAWCDRALMRRALANLIGNAFKHGRDGTVVTGGARVAANGIELWVADDGPGIPPEQHRRIFDKFGSVAAGEARRYSTGLGLPFCKLAVEAHGGRIGVDSAPGRGSRFWLQLPGEPAAAR